jgi:hypothetical protein
MKPTKH